MKRFLTMFASALLLCAALCVSASASDFDDVATELSAIGMFRGTGTSFELDRAPTRAEAAIMLTRLYGAEEAATADYAAGKIAHPFTDVPEYAAPHIAWLYTQGLTKGMSADQFGSAAACSAQSYATFLLRALGYQDGEDFDYADALAFAQEKGFYSPLMFGGDFLRDDLAAMTYQALAADTKGGKTYLLSQLIQDGAVDKTAAAPMTEKMELYRELCASDGSLDANALDMDLLMALDMTMTAQGETLTSSTSAYGNVQTIVEGTDVELAYILTTISDGAMMDMGIWMKDGWVYQYASDGALTQTIKYAVTDEFAMLEELGVPESTGMDVSDLAAVKSITKEKDGTDTIYTLVIAEGMGGMMDSVMDLVGQSLEDGSELTANIGEVRLYYLLDRKGNLKELGMQMPYYMTMNVADEDGTLVGVEASCDMRMVMTVNATGKDVTIEYPDLSAFVEVDLTEDATLPAA